MSENKKYYYLKFKENYFEQDHIKVIESMKNGYEYSLIILKLYLKSLKYEGQLKINDAIPYTRDKIDLLSGVLGHNPAEVMHAVNLAKDLGIIEFIDTGEIFMSDIQSFIGTGSSEGDRKKAYRDKLAYRKQLQYDWTKGGQMSDKRPPEIELEKELEKEIDIKTDKKQKKEYADNVKMTEKEYKKLLEKYGDIQTNRLIQYLSDYKKEKGYKTKSDYLTILRWVVDAAKVKEIPEDEKIIISQPAPENNYLDQLRESSSD